MKLISPASYLSLVIILFGNIPNAFTENEPVFKFTDRGLILSLYQLLKDTQEIFSKAGIEYWIESGTLLGAVRCKGIIKWDTDIDLQMDISQKNKFRAIRGEFRKLGYEVKKKSFGYSIYKGNTILDVFFSININDKIMHEAVKVRYWWGKRGKDPIYITEEELYPLELYKFGALSVWGPRNPYPYLYALYGMDCMDIGYLQIQHEGNSYAPTRLTLTPELKQPAEPLGPLMDRELKE